MGRCISCGGPVEGALLCPDCARPPRRGRLGFDLMRLGPVEERELTRFLSQHFGVPSINLSEFQIPPEIIALVPADVARARVVLPVNRAGASLIVAMAAPADTSAIDALRALTGLNVEVVVASVESIREAIAQYYEGA